MNDCKEEQRKKVEREFDQRNINTARPVLPRAGAKGLHRTQEAW